MLISLFGSSCLVFTYCIVVVLLLGNCIHHSRWGAVLDDDISVPNTPITLRTTLCLVRNYSYMSDSTYSVFYGNQSFFANWSS